MNPLVTVLLPVYNGEKYLHDALQSIVDQHFKDFELLIVDDGSTDRSSEIIGSFRDSRIRVLKNSQRLKLSGALNRGIIEAKGTYIARMDADDIALPERLTRQVDYLEKYSEIGLCGTWVEKFGQGGSSVITYPDSPERVRAYSLFDCPFAHPTVMFRRKLFSSHNLSYDGSYYPTEDYELWARALACFPAINLPKVLLRYRVHGQSMTGSDWDQMDGQAARVAGKLLMKLGVSASTEDLQLHRNIGRGSSFRVKDMAELEKGEAWLLHLKDRNMEVGYFKEAAFLEILSLIWFRLCMQNTWLGFDLLKRFAGSLLCRASRKRAQDLALITASIMKNNLVTFQKQ